MTVMGIETLDKVYADYASDEAFAHLRRHATQLVKGVGPLDPAVVFVGEAPGKDEDKSGTPFVGRSGQYFNTLLDSINLSRDDVFITNIVKYRPQENRDPTMGEIVLSKKYLDRELACLSCDIIVPLGRHSLSVFLPQYQLREVHGRQFEVDGKFIVPQYHPAVGGVYRPKDMGPVMVQDFETIGLVLDALETRENS